MYDLYHFQNERMILHNTHTRAHTHTDTHINCIQHIHT